MFNMDISKSLKDDLLSNQNQLKNAIWKHQNLLKQLQNEDLNSEIQKKIELVQQEIIVIGLEQKTLTDRLRKELKLYQKDIKNDVCKNGLEQRRTNLSNALNRARKQNIAIRPASVTSFIASDDSAELPSGNTSPEPASNPVNPHDVTQGEFLNNFGLVTHEVYKELQSKRVERKRRSTANPQFLYGSRGWDFTSKRKRNAYLLSNMSPPNTRQAVKNRQIKADGGSPPGYRSGSRPSSPIEPLKKILPSFPSIPNLPSGLTIERVNPNRASPDSKLCITCRLPGTLSICESCLNGFHVSCHNRPLVQPPRKCPKCLANKDVRTIGSLTVPSGMSVSYVSTDVADKLQEKQKLLEENKTLTAELTQLQDRHSQLTISLKNQKTAREDLLTTQQSTEDKIKQILTFIDNVKSIS